MAQVEGLPAAIETLDRGEVIVIPTDTVYGLAARPDLASAVAAIFSIKHRARDQALPVLGADVDALRQVVEIDRRAAALGEAFWPGPLTLVLPRAAGFRHDLGGDDRDTVAVRVPALDTTLLLLAATGPLAVTSANRSGAPPAVTVEEARAALGDQVDVFIDGGRVGGAPSTVLDLVHGPRVLRQGALSGDELMARFD